MSRNSRGGAICDGFVSGHDFSRAAKEMRSTWALQAAEKLIALKGHDFSRATKAIESTWALAPEGSLPPISSEIPSFSAASLAPAVCSFSHLQCPQRLKPESK